MYSHTIKYYFPYPLYARIKKERAIIVHNTHAHEYIGSITPPKAGCPPFLLLLLPIYIPPTNNNNKKGQGGIYISSNKFNNIITIQMRLNLSESW